MLSVSADADDNAGNATAASTATVNASLRKVAPLGVIDFGASN
jgi:hypothetical protein